MGSLGVVAYLLTSVSSIATLIDICMHAYKENLTSLSFTYKMSGGYR
jgi:hypothetical protein